MDFDPAKLDDMSRKELQALAKEHGVKANQKTATIIEELRALAGSAGTKRERSEEEEAPPAKRARGENEDAGESSIEQNEKSTGDEKKANAAAAEEDSEAKKAAEEAARKKAAEEAAAKEKEAAAKKRAEEEAEKRAREEAEAEARKKMEAEAARRAKEAEEAEKKRKKEEEAAAKKAKAAAAAAAAAPAPTSSSAAAAPVPAPAASSAPPKAAPAVPKPAPKPAPAAPQARSESKTSLAPCTFSPGFKQAILDSFETSRQDLVSKDAAQTWEDRQRSYYDSGGDSRPSALVRDWIADPKKTNACLQEVVAVRRLCTIRKEAFAFWALDKTRADITRAMQEVTPAYVQHVQHAKEGSPVNTSFVASPDFWDAVVSTAAKYEHLPPYP